MASEEFSSSFYYILKLMLSFADLNCRNALKLTSTLFQEKCPDMQKLKK